jgi:hypothetical protein
VARLRAPVFRAPVFRAPVLRAPVLRAPVLRVDRLADFARDFVVVAEPRVPVDVPRGRPRRGARAPFNNSARCASHRSLRWFLESTLIRTVFAAGLRQTSHTMVTASKERSFVEKLHPNGRKSTVNGPLHEDES